MAKLYDTPIKAIRKKCLDCSCWSPKEVRKCTVINCPIYPYRFGRRPDKSTIDTLNKFYAENIEPTGGGIMKNNQIKLVRGFSTNEFNNSDPINNKRNRSKI